jgi:hypothetical protein
MDPFAPGYPHSQAIQKGLDYIFGKATLIPIGVQSAGNPDRDGNGVGVGFEEDET